MVSPLETHFTKSWFLINEATKGVLNVWEILRETVRLFLRGRVTACVWLDDRLNCSPPGR